jgi:hypothetical protein
MAWFADPSGTLVLLMHAVVSQRLFPSDPPPAVTRTAGSLSKASGPRATHPSGAGRRRNIARCRVLRATIQKFEDTFTQDHRRKPHGAEREPMRDVYLEYKTLKQQIRGAKRSICSADCPILLKSRVNADYMCAL